MLYDTLDHNFLGEETASPPPEHGTSSGRKCRVEGMKVPPIREKGGTYLFSYSFLEDIKIMKNLAPCTPLTLHIFSAIDFGRTRKVFCVLPKGILAVRKRS